MLIYIFSALSDNKIDIKLIKSIKRIFREKWTFDVKQRKSMKSLLEERTALPHLAITIFFRSNFLESFELNFFFSFYNLY